MTIEHTTITFCKTRCHCLPELLKWENKKLLIQLLNLNCCLLIRHFSHFDASHPIFGRNLGPFVLLLMYSLTVVSCLAHAGIASINCPVLNQMVPTASNSSQQGIKTSLDFKVRVDVWSIVRDIAADLYPLILFSIRCFVHIFALFEELQRSHNRK